MALLAFLAAPLLAAGFLPATGEDGTGAPFDLWRRRALAPRVEVLEPAESPSGAVAAARARIRRDLEDREARPVVSRSAPSDFSRGSLRVVAGLSSEAVVRESLRGVAGLSIEPGRIVSGPETLDQPTDAVVLFAEAGGAPTLALLAHTEAALVALAATVEFPDRPSSLSLRNGEIGGFPRAVAEFASFETGATTYRFAPGGVDEARIADLHARHRAAQQRLEEALGPYPPSRVEVFVYPSLSSKAAATGDRGPAHVNLVGRRVHLVEGAGWSPSTGEEFLRATLFDVLGLAASRALETGLARWCAVSIPGRPGVPALAARLRSAHFAPKAEDAVDPVARRGLSRSILDVLDAVLADETLRELGRARFERLYRGEDPPASAAERAARLERALAGMPEAGVASALRRQEAVAALPLRGFVLPQVQLDRTDLGSAFVEMKALGANVVMLDLARRLGAGAEDRAAEARIEEIASLARSRGLALCLRTRLLELRGGTWAGDQFVLHADEWGDLFRELDQRLVDDALLAERIGSSWWFVGCELRGSSGMATAGTLWRDRIARLRSLFHGAMSYGASWGPVPTRPLTDADEWTPRMEYEQVAFWDLLDAVAVSAAFPLSLEETPPDTVLEAAVRGFAESIESMSRRFGKPVILYDVGYSATSATFRTPWRENGAADLEAQSRSWRAFVSALGRRDWLGGAFVRAGDFGSSRETRGDRAFEVSGRPASNGLLQLFRLLGRP